MSCNVSETAKIGLDCRIGDNVIIHDYAVIYDGTQIGAGTEIFEGAVIGRPPKDTGTLVHKLEKTFAPVKIGEACVIGANAVIYAGTDMGNRVLIGDGAKIRENCSFEDNVIIGTLCSLNHHVTIKKNSKIMNNSHLTGWVVVEEDVLIGTGVSSANDYKMRIKGEAVSAEEARILLKARCRIGSGSVLLPGIVVEEEAVVGAGSVVLSSVPARVTVMGSPAAIVWRAKPRKDK